MARDSSIPKKVTPVRIGKNPGVKIGHTKGNTSGAMASGKRKG